VKQLEAVYDKVGLAADADGWPPVLPAVGMLADVERCAEQTDDDNRQGMISH
jgi:hypothetical protein